MVQKAKHIIKNNNFKKKNSTYQLETKKVIQNLKCYKYLKKFFKKIDIISIKRNLKIDV